MWKRAVADVVQKNRKLCGFKLFRRDLNAFEPQVFENASHQMHRAKRMLETRVHGARINVIRQSKLFDMPQPLKVRMWNNVEDQVAWNGDETIDRIVDDFLFIRVKIWEFRFQIWNLKSKI